VIAGAVALLVATAVAAPPGASRSAPALALTATPARLALVGAARQVIRVANRGSGPLVVDAAPAGFTLGLRGAPRILLRGAAARRAASWLRVRPSRLVLDGGESAEVVVTSVLPRAAPPGDHATLVLLTTRPPPSTSVGVRIRIGVTAVVRVPGRVRHALAIRSLRVRATPARCVLRLVVANAGNVVESLRRGVDVSLVAGGRRVARLRSAAREFLPHSRGVVEVLYRGTLRGAVTARVTATPRTGPALRRSFRLLL
jgi:hypothetical protein